MALEFLDRDSKILTSQKSKAVINQWIVTLPEKSGPYTLRIIEPGKEAPIWKLALVVDLDPPAIVNQSAKLIKKTGSPTSFSFQISVTFDDLTGVTCGQAKIYSSTLADPVMMVDLTKTELESKKTFAITATDLPIGSTPPYRLELSCADQASNAVKLNSSLLLDAG